MWAIKTPNGKLIPATARKNKQEVIENFIRSQVKHGFIIDVIQWRGEHYYEKMWKLLEDYDYKVVECYAEQHTDGTFSWPELIQLPKQLPLI